MYIGVSDTGYTGDTSGLTSAGVAVPNKSGIITSLGYSASAPWAFIPIMTDNSIHTAKYLTDYLTYATYTNCQMRVGSTYGDTYQNGMFNFTMGGVGLSENYIGSRLIYIP